MASCLALLGGAFEVERRLKGTEGSPPRAGWGLCRSPSKHFTLVWVPFEVERGSSDKRLLASPVGLFLMVGWLVLCRVKESHFVGRLTRRGRAWWLGSFVGFAHL